MQRLRTKTHRLLILAASTCLLAIPGYAGDFSPEKEIDLTIGSAVALSLTNNARLRAAHMDTEIAHLALRGERAYWEPALVLSADYEENKRQNTVQDELSMFAPVFEEENASYSTAIEGLLPSGAKYRVGYSLHDTANNLTNLTFREMAPFEHEYVSFVGFNLTQPLLKNRGFRVTHSGIKDARLRKEIARQQLRREKMMAIASTEIAFWDAWAAQNLTALRNQSLDIASALLKDNEQRHEQGKMSEIEVEQARVGVARRRRRWLGARARYQEALRDLMNAMGIQMDTDKVTITAGDPMPAKKDDAFEERMRTAMSKHPDLIVARRQIDLHDLRLAVAKNQRWPQLDLVASYGLNGLGDSVEDSYNVVADTDYPSWAVSCVLKLPLAGDRAAWLKARAAKIEQVKALESYKAAEDDVVNMLRTATTRVSLLKEMEGALAQEVKAGLMALENEKVLLENGKSTSRSVLEREEDLSDSRVEHIDIQAGLRKLMVQIDVSDGGMLARRGLEVEE